MRSIWTGVVSFGMVTIPVKLYGATEEKSVKLKLLHRKDGSPIEERRFCKEEGVEVEWDDLVRGYEVGKGDFVVLEPEEIEAAEPESARSIEIGDFVELEEIDPIYFEKAYFLEPQEAGAKAFNLLRRALDMARTLVENLSARFNPEQYEDRYRIALQELIEQKMKGEVRNAKRRKAEPKVVDLMAALEASLASAREGKAQGGDAKRPGGTKAGARKADATTADADANDEDKPAKRKAPARKRKAA